MDGFGMINATYVDHMGTDLSVVNAARVSFDKSSEWDVTYNSKDNPFDFDESLSEADTRLINYLAKHKHTSPFGHAFISVHVKAPIFVARQLVKHKFLRWNEVSRRYVDDTPTFYQPVWRGRAENVKQGSSGDLEEEQQQTSWYEYDMSCIAALNTYLNMIDDGVCPEQSRMVLPQSMMTEWYWSGSLDAFADMCKLRLKSDTQKETRAVAEYVNSIISPLFPVSWKALLNE